MNHFKYEDIKINDEVEFSYQLNNEKMQMFRKITNDENPLHTDLKYAQEKGYNEKVVYGMLTSSALSTLAGMYMPGEQSLIYNVEVSFLKPVFLSNCPLIVRGVVKEKDDRFRLIKLKVIITDTNNEKVLKGNMTIGFTTVS